MVPFWKIFTRNRFLVILGMRDDETRLVAVQKWRQSNSISLKLQSADRSLSGTLRVFFFSRAEKPDVVEVKMRSK